MFIHSQNRTGFARWFSTRCSLWMACLGLIALALVAPAAAQPRPPADANTAPLPTDATPVRLQQAGNTANIVSLYIRQVDNAPRPSLFLNSSGVRAVQARLGEGSHRDIWQNVREYARSQRGTEPPTRLPNNVTMPELRDYGDQIVGFAQTCLLTGNEQDCDLARTYLLTYAGWSTWDIPGERDLGTSHMLLGVSVSYDWLYNRLSAAERQTVREAIGRNAQLLYEASSSERRQDINNWWRTAYLQNHFWTNHGALGMAGLTLLGEDERAQTWVDHARTRLAGGAALLDGMADGTWHESISYQAYGLSMSLPFLHNLRRIQGVDIIPHTYLRNYGLWMTYNLLPNTTQVIMAFGDFEWHWLNGARTLSVLRFAAREYDDGYAEWVAQQLERAPGRTSNSWIMPHYSYELLYYDPTVAATDPESTLAGHRLFPDLAALIWRTGWGTDDLVFGLKMGVYGGHFAHRTYVNEQAPWPVPCTESGCSMHIGHDHMDTNTFYLYRAGRWLAPEDEGNGDRDTAYHNTLLIDGQNQYRPDNNQLRDPNAHRDSAGFLEAQGSGSVTDYVASDATNRYRRSIADIQDVTRHVLFVRPDYFLMVDNLEAGQPHDYAWIAHFGEQGSREGRWIRGDAGDGHVLGINVLAPADFSTEFGSNDRPYVRIRPTNTVATTRLVHLLYPTDTGGWNTKPEAELRTDTGTALLVAVPRPNGQRDELLVTYAAGALGQPSTTGRYTFDGRAAMVRWASNDNPLRVFTIGGSSLTDETGTRQLVAGITDMDNPFEAVYDGTTVRIATSQTSGTLRVYAPQATTLLRNGEEQPFTRDGDTIVIDLE